MCGPPGALPGGLAVHELSAGPTTLLALHGASFCARVLEPMAHGLEGRARVVAPDLPGHGRSPRPLDGDFSWRALAAEVRRVAAHLGDGLVGFGHSLGATALLLAAEPGQFRALYLFEPIVVLDEEARAAARKLAARARLRQREFPSKEAALAYFASRPPLSDFDEDALAAYVEDGLVEDERGCRLVLEPEDEAALYLGGLDVSLDELVSRCRLPVVVARGATSADLGARGAEALGAALGIDVERLAGVAHFAPLAQPGVVAASVSTTTEAPPA